MTILALEFSSSQRSVAVARNGRVLAEAVETGERGTNAFGMIEKVLAAAKLGRADIKCLAVGLGPGSYTGIRVALSIAQGWQLARGVKLLGVGSVECLAAQAQAQKNFGRVNIVIDAQRGEFYLAACDISADGVKEIEPLKIVAATEVESRAQAGEILTGPEVTRWFAAGKILFPQAAMLAALAASRGDYAAGEKLEPVYLRETNFVKVQRPDRLANGFQKILYRVNNQGTRDEANIFWIIRQRRVPTIASQKSVPTIGTQTPDSVRSLESKIRHASFMDSTRGKITHSIC